MNDQKPVTPEDLFELSFLQAGALSPDGRQVVYAVSAFDEETDKDVSQLWLLDVDTSTRRQLTFGPASNSQPAWSPDGRSLAFVSDRDEKPQLYQLALAGGWFITAQNRPISLMASLN